MKIQVNAINDFVKLIVLMSMLLAITELFMDKSDSHLAAFIAFENESLHSQE